MPKLADFLNNFIYPILVALVMPIAMVIGSQWATGDYSTWLSQVPFIVKIGFVIFNILWFGIVIVRNRLKSIQPSGVGVFTVSRWGYKEIGTIDLHGVKWRIIAPLSPPYSFQSGPDLTPSRIRIRVPPRCPKCETELEESKSFLWGYNWKCVRCGWNKRNKDNFSRVKEQVEKIAQREMELRLSEDQEG